MTETNTPSVAVAGCGYWGRNLVRNFAELGALRAVCDADAASAQTLAETYDVPARGWDDILADPGIPGVAIATPLRPTRRWREALAAGKHVFVEKPMALDLADAEDLIARAADAGRALMVGHLLQYHAAFQTLREHVARGDIGALRYVYSNRLNFGKVRHEENILWSFAPHDISMILSLAGAEPERVDAIGHNYLQPGIADTTTTHLHFPGGMAVHIFVSWLHPFKEQKLVVIGEDGMMVFDDTRDWAEKLVLYPHKVAPGERAPIAERADAQAIAIAPSEPLRSECTHFLGCVAGEHDPRTDGAEGLRVLRVLHAAQQALDH